MKDKKDPIITRNFLQNLSRGIVKSIPIGGALLEQVIYGTLDGEAAAKEVEKLHSALSRISHKPEGQDLTLHEILNALKEDQTVFHEKIVTELSKVGGFITDPDFTNIPENLDKAVGTLLDKYEELKGILLDETGNIKELIRRLSERIDNTLIKPILPKELTVRIPKISQDKIIGRNNDMIDLHNRLFNSKQVVLVNGLGGIGKTTLAQAYVGKYYSEYQHIAWISQISNEFINDFVNTDGFCNSLEIEREGKQVDDLFNEIIMKLKRVNTNPNLLIIDNAEASLAQCYDMLPSQPNWHILVTSRQEIQKFDLKQLGFLTEPEAIDLFLKHYTRGKISRESITDLVRLVDKHTLTIELLAKTAQKQRTSIERLKTAIADDLKSNIYVDHKGSKIEKVSSYLNSIFTLSDLNKNEIWLVKQLACLPPDFYGYDDLHDWINPEKSQKEEDFSETLEELVANGWVLQNKETDQYKMHRIIADIVPRQLTITFKDVSPLVETVTKKLTIDQNKDNPVNKFPWIPFGTQLLLFFANDDSSQIAVLQNNLALVLKALGDYAGAKILLEKAMISTDKNFGADHPTTAVSYSNLATVLKDLGDYAGAKILLEKAMSSDEKNFGADHPTTAVSYSNLALVLQALGDYAGAKILLEKAMSSAEKNFGADHPTTAVSYSNLATVLHGLGDYVDALQLSEKALLVFKKALPVGHPTIATVTEINEHLKKVVAQYKGINPGGQE